MLGLFKNVFSVTARLFALGALWAGASAMASDSKVLPIGVAEFPPFKYTDPATRKIVGADTEVVEQVFKRMGYAPQINMQPWIRVQQATEKGEFAALYTFTKTPEREEKYYFSDPISTVKDVFYKMKKRKIAWQNLETDLKDLKVGVSAGYSYAQVFKDAVAQNKFGLVDEVYGTVPELANLRKLVAGRIDVFICEVSVCQYIIRTYAPEFAEVDFIPNPIGPVRTFHAGFSKKWPGAEQLTKDFNAELAKFVKEGHRKKLFTKYQIITDLK